MARDPFAPVTQPSIPHWVWVITGSLAVVLVFMSSAAYVVLHRNHSAAPTPAVATTPAAPAPALPAGTATASAAPAGAPDKAESKGEAKEDKGGEEARGDHRSAHAHHRRGKAAAAGKTGAGPAAAPAVARKKHDMSQKEIDNLLGL